MKTRILTLTISLAVCCITWAQNPGVKKKQPEDSDTLINRQTNNHRSPHGEGIPIIEQPFRPVSLIPKGFLPVIASLPLAYIEEAPEKLELMPKVEAQGKWPNTKIDDEIYDITKWFRGVINTNSITKQWVYYNNTSKHLIMCGDIFLRTNVHDYVFNQIYSYPKQLRINLEYIEVDESMPIDIDSIKKADYKLFYKNSVIQSTYSQCYYDTAEFKLKMEGGPRFGKGIELGSTVVSLELEAEGFGKVVFSTLVITGETVVKELGASPFGKKKLLILKADTLNSHNIAIMIPPSQAQFEKEMFEIEDDPFFSTPYIVTYKVMHDFLELMIEAKDDQDMAKQKEALLVPKEHPFFSPQGKVYDIAPLLKAAGLPVDNVKSCAYLKLDTFQIIAYMDSNTHDIMEDLLATLGGDPPELYNLEAQIYEVDSSQDEVRRATDLLQKNPKPLVKLATPILYDWGWGARENLIKSKIGYFRTLSEDEIELELDLKSGGIQFKGSFSIHRHTQKAKVLEISKSKNPGRVYVIVLEVEQLQEIPSDSYP